MPAPPFSVSKAKVAVARYVDQLYGIKTANYVLCSLRLAVYVQTAKPHCLGTRLKLVTTCQLWYQVQHRPIRRSKMTTFYRYRLGSVAHTALQQFMVSLKKATPLQRAETRLQSDKTLPWTMYLRKNMVSSAKSPLQMFSPSMLHSRMITYQPGTPLQQVTV